VYIANVGVGGVWRFFLFLWCFCFFWGVFWGGVGGELSLSVTVWHQDGARHASLTPKHRVETPKRTRAGELVRGLITGSRGPMASRARRKEGLRAVYFLDPLS